MATVKRRRSQKGRVGQRASGQAARAEESAEEPWEAYWHRKQRSRRDLRRTYIKLSIFTLLFGLLTISLRLDLRLSGGQSWLEFQQWLGSLWSKQAVDSQGEPLELEEILRKLEPSPAELKSLESCILSPEMLQVAEETWGSSRLLVGSGAELELRYFRQSSIYLLRKRSDWRIVYVGQKAP